MRRSAVCAFMAVITLGWGQVSAQSVSFETPYPWMSSRSDSMAVTVFFDTVKTMNKTMKISFEKSARGRRAALGSSRFTITSNSHSVPFTKVKKRIFGGTDFISMEWRILGTKESGTIGPFGIAAIDTYDDMLKFPAYLVSENEPVGAVRAAMGDAETGMAIGTARVRFFYTKRDFYIAVAGATLPGALVVAFDGKNSKRAFLAYADRFLRYDPAAKTANGFHYSRSFDPKRGISYSEKKWHVTPSVQMTEKGVIISAPWHDIGFVPLNRTMAGMALFLSNADGRIAATLPAKADRRIPVTWGNLVLMDELTAEEKEKMFGE